MIDLSNNNPSDIDFHTAYTKGGQRRLYVKVTEGTSFIDGKAKDFATRAKVAGFQIGGYHFGHSEADPGAQAAFFRLNLAHLGGLLTLPPVLDYESGTPDADWARRFISAMGEGKTILYSYGDFISRCYFNSPPAPLWLANYGANDGHMHPFTIPAPWKEIAAHQFTSEGKVPGIPFAVDLTQVLDAKAFA